MSTPSVISDEYDIVIAGGELSLPPVLATSLHPANRVLFRL